MAAQNILKKLGPVIRAIRVKNACQDVVVFASFSTNASVRFGQKKNQQEEPYSRLKENKNVLNINSREFEFKFREKYVPITRRSVVRSLLDEIQDIQGVEKDDFNKLVSSLEGAIIFRFHVFLQQLKNFFDPINPDKDTVIMRIWDEDKRLKKEQELLDLLAVVMAKANFQEIPRPIILNALAEHSTNEGIMVSVNPENYDILRFWALGSATFPEEFPWYYKMYHKTAKKPLPKPVKYYKRVVVAVRHKKDTKLLLKTFKEVPMNALEQLLPDGRIRMNNFDRTVLFGTLLVGSIGIGARAMPMLEYDLGFGGTLALASVAGFISFRAWTSYKHRRNKYLLELNKMLYFKNIANNRGLLALYVDRAEDETFKEVLLAYTFIFKTMQEDLKRGKYYGGITASRLEHIIEEWIHDKTGFWIQFDADEPLQILKQYGLIRFDGSQIYSVSVKEALNLLPTLAETSLKEKDSGEDEDSDIFQEVIDDGNDDDHIKQLKKQKELGWK